MSKAQVAGRVGWGVVRVSLSGGAACLTHHQLLVLTTAGGAHARDWAVAAVRARIAAFSGYDLGHLEPLQVLSARTPHARCAHGIGRRMYGCTVPHVYGLLGLQGGCVRLQVVRYHPGEKYESHHDSFDLCDFAQRPRRHLTFLIYLNDLPGGGAGHTSFPRLNLQIEPRARAALVFNDVLDNGRTALLVLTI